jgi:hypothetical protein
MTSPSIPKSGFNREVRAALAIHEQHERERRAEDCTPYQDENYDIIP